MIKDDYPSELVKEAIRLTDKVIRQSKSPTPRASTYNRCLESLERIQKKSWDATDKKWSEILATEQETQDRLRAEIAQKSERIDDLEATLSCDEEKICALHYPNPQPPQRSDP